MKQLSKNHGLTDLWMKDEGLNPTGSFKARGISMAVSKAKEFGVKACVIPTAGNAGSALSAYCSAAGIQATVVMPSNTPMIYQDECKKYGAELILVDGLIDKSGQMAYEIQIKTGAFNMATLKEPYRLEGKKTMGYEIAEQMDWTLPDVIIYPTGGGTGLIGIWKAFNEMLALNWIAPNTTLPKMIVVQSTECSPIVDKFNRNTASKSYRMSIAHGLSVPHAFGEGLILKVIKESKGCAIAVSDQKILAGVTEVCSAERMAISPEGASTWEALKLLIDQGKIRKNEKILLLNTGNGNKAQGNICS